MHYRAHSVAACACVSVLFASLTHAQTQPGAYHLGPGDRVSITVLGESDLSMEVRIPQSGVLRYPLLGDVRIEGLTIDELEQLITEGLKGPYLVEPRVAITLVAFRPLVVRGAVQRPGDVVYQDGLTIAGAIALAGGFTGRASRSRIEVIRALDPARVVIGSLSTPVFPGDIITVSPGLL